MSPATGDQVRVEMSKWGDRPHWEFAAAFLGSDRHGEWIGVPIGTLMSRPGAQFATPADQVTLVPWRADDLSVGWLATFHASGGPVEVYVDITTPPEWKGDVLHAVDLDLDVIRDHADKVWVDDEDEFAVHQVAFNYPAHIVREAQELCERVRSAVWFREPPYDNAAHGWLRQVRTAAQRHA